MIIVGYQGIGKSTLAARNKYIDLESSNFFVDGKRDENWYIPYCKIAMMLSTKGYNVCVSSHKVVRDYLIQRARYSELLFVIPEPSEHMRDIWVQELKERYENTASEKDFKAWKNAEEHYLDNTKEIASAADCGVPVLVLVKPDYCLAAAIEDYRFRHYVVSN